MQSGQISKNTALYKNSSQEESIYFPEIPEEDPGKGQEDQDEDLYKRLRKLKKSDQNSASPTCWEAAKLTASPFTVESRPNLATNENRKKEQNEEMFNLFCPTLHVENVLNAEACLSACGSSKELDNLPTQNTAPCGTRHVYIPQHKEQDVHSGIAKGTPSHIAQPVTQVVKIPEQDFYNWLDKEICMEDIRLPEHKYKKDKQNTEETLSVTNKTMSTDNLMNMMMLIILWSTMVVIMKRKYDPPVRPCCRCK